MASKRKGKEIKAFGSDASRKTINNPQSWNPIQGSRAKE